VAIPPLVALEAVDSPADPGASEEPGHSPSPEPEFRALPPTTPVRQAIRNAFTRRSRSAGEVPKEPPPPAPPAPPSPGSDRPWQPDPWKVFVGLLTAGCVTLLIGVLVAIYGGELNWLRPPIAAISFLLGLGAVGFAFAYLAESRQDWRQLLGNFLFNGIFAVALVLALLPIIAILRGAIALISEHAGFGPGDVLGTSLAFVALLLGSMFFAYSIKYYLGTGLVLLTTLLSPQTNGNGNGNSHGLTRISRRGNGHNGNGNGHNGNGHNGNGNGNGHFDLGYHPRVSIHVASYNEKRVIERLLTALANLEYPNYEVVWVDDSNGETMDIIERWIGRALLQILILLSLGR